MGKLIGKVDDRNTRRTFARRTANPRIFNAHIVEHY